jgi:hypothetical protein
LAELWQTETEIEKPFRLNHKKSLRKSNKFLNRIKMMRHF